MKTSFTRNNLIALCVLVLSLAMPERATAQDTYQLTIRDSTEIGWIFRLSSSVTVHFNDPTLNAIMSGYTVTQFERVYPTSRFGHLRNVGA